jgi:hypothetical protein
MRMGLKGYKLASAAPPAATAKPVLKPPSAFTGTPAWRAGILLKQILSVKFADLHVHTRISDGWISPGEAVRRAYLAGLSAIAIADHDSVNGIQSAIWAGRKYGVEIIPAVELSSGIDNHEFHILGYYIDWQNKRFMDKLSTLQEARRERARRIIDRLQELGMDISYNLIIALDGGVVGRPHIAQALADSGYVRTMDEAFDKYLGMGKPAYVTKYPLTPAKAIKLIREVGGLPVLAHPVFARGDHMLPQLVEEGLRGIEVYHSKHDAAMIRRYKRLARRYGLLMTGGSDSHGMEDMPIGHVRVPYTLVERIKKKLAAGQKGGGPKERD